MNEEKLSPIAQKLSTADAEEWRKCEESSVYFYNNYVREEGQPKMSEADYAEYVESVEGLLRNPKNARPFQVGILIPKDCVYIETSNETT